VCTVTNLGPNASKPGRTVTLRLGTAGVVVHKKGTGPVAPNGKESGPNGKESGPNGKESGPNGNVHGANGKENGKNHKALVTRTLPAMQPGQTVSFQIPMPQVTGPNANNAVLILSISHGDANPANDHQVIRLKTTP
jgi:hypothetical protein